MILTTIAIVGLMSVIGKYRRPGVKFASFITIFNRKEKLTEAGAKLYLVFFFLLVSGLAFSIISPSDFGNYEKRTEPVAIENKGGESQAENSMQKMTRLSMISAEAIASQIPNVVIAQGALESCNEGLSSGMNMIKQGMDDSNLKFGVRECISDARSVCNNGPSTSACERL